MFHVWIKLRSIRLAELKKIMDIWYHYTSISGLCNIFSSKVIWATSICHQKDGTEFDYALDLARIVLDCYKQSNADFLFFNTIYQMLSSRDEIMRYFDVFSASFSKSGDLANQWREYCPKGQGFCIGFDSSEFYNDKIPFFHPERCVYDQDENLGRICLYLEETLTNWRAMPKDLQSESNARKCADSFFSQFSGYASRMKCPRFREEQEMRLISNGVGQVIVKNHPAIKVRGNKSNPIPYWELPLAANGEKVIIRELIASPSQDTNLLINIAKELARAFRDRIELEEDKIKVSTISYERVRPVNDWLRF